MDAVLAANLLEQSFFDRNAKASVIGTAYEMVQNSGQKNAFCSDCCGSNGNVCDPNDPY